MCIDFGLGSQNKAPSQLQYPELGEKLIYTCIYRVNLALKYLFPTLFETMSEGLCKLHYDTASRDPRLASRAASDVVKLATNPMIEVNLSILHNWPHIT